MCFNYQVTSFIVTVNNCIYVSWWGTYPKGITYHTISKHDMSGQVINRYGVYGRGIDIEACYLRHPLIRGVDSSGRMLVCDFYNRRMLICTNEGEWSVAGEMSDIEGQPRCIVLKNNVVYIGCDTAEHVHKYMLTSEWSGIWLFHATWNHCGF